MTEERRAPLPQKFISWMDRRHIVSVRSTVLAVTIWMTWEVTKWAFKFAYEADMPGLEKAAVIAAVTTPFSALQAFTFKFYMGAKDGNP